MEKENFIIEDEKQFKKTDYSLEDISSIERNFFQKNVKIPIDFYLHQEEYFKGKRIEKLIILLGNLLN